MYAGGNIEGADEVPSLSLVAPWFELDILLRSWVPLWAAPWLAGSYDSPAIVHLAGLSGETHTRCGMCSGTLAECGVATSDPAAAAARQGDDTLLKQQAAATGESRLLWGR